ncbi:MAG: hypothetical protein COU70_00895, partial [Parcubacteria group bacterium CG10_big_fil_rev_8_21_14_0_10_35_15]
MLQQTLDKIVEKYDDKDKKLILEAFYFAKAAHQGQKRLSGEDYIVHPLRATLILSHLNVDAKSIVACLLHDVIDDTNVSLEKLEEKFGEEVSFLVKGVSRLGKIRLPKQHLEIGPIEKRSEKTIDFEAENLRRMFFAMAEDIRVIIIKLADRTHNMETLEFIPEEKQKRIALETMEIFAPIANRLGIQTIKTKLENLAFPYLYPKEYQWLIENIRERHLEAKKYLEKEKLLLEKGLREESVDFVKIQSRLKSYFSLYQKLLRYEMDFDRIRDLVALRVIVKDVKTCYEVLGLIHKIWRPIPGRIKDYIAFPKPNGYQSLHTTVFCKDGKIIEVQIRSEEMHEIAERGICAHWATKEGIDLKKRGERFSWVKELANWQKESPAGQEYLNDLKIDFFKNRIFILTPKGDIIDLPEGACPIDFAYAVHSEIGNHCVGAKINGKIIPLSNKLKNGDVVEILIDKNRKPSKDWLKFVKTGMARSHIKRQTQFNIFIELKQRFFPENKFAKITKKELISQKNEKSIIVIGGKTRVAYFLAKCCKPKNGEDIAAYLTKTKGA